MADLHMVNMSYITFSYLCVDAFQGQLGSTQNKGLIPCVLLVLKEMLPTYHKWRYNTYGVRERIGENNHFGQVGEVLPSWESRNQEMFYVMTGCLILELIHAILNLSSEGEDQGR